MPAFNLVKNLKSKRGEEIDSLRYEEWRDNALKIALKSGTTVLTVDYDDTEKENIIPVLNKISEIFQEYSVKQSKQNIASTGSFLKNQISIFEGKSEKSIEELQEFSTKHGLLLPVLSTVKSSGKEENSLSNSNDLNNYLVLMNPNNNINIRINNISSKLKILKKADVKGSDVLLIAESLRSSIIPDSLIEEYKRLDSEIEKKTYIFKKSDPDLISLNKYKNELIEVIRNKILENLEADLFSLKIEKESNSKPKEIVSKFRQLFGIAIRNSISLENLEKELHYFQIQEAKSQVPWNLITEPTVLDEPVGPIRLLIIMQSLLYGAGIGITIATIRIFIKNKIFSEMKIKKIFNTKILEILSATKLDSWDDQLRLIKEDPSVDEQNSVAIIYIENIKEKFIDKVNEIFDIKNPNQYIVTKDILKAKKYKNKILLFQKGSISATELINFSNRLFNQGIYLKGILLVDDEGRLDHNFILSILRNYDFKKLKT